MYFCLTLWSQQTNLCKRLYIKHIKFFTDLSQPTTKLFEIQEISTTYTKWLTSHDLGEVVHCWACHSKGHWKTRTLFCKFWPFPIQIENIKAYMHVKQNRLDQRMRKRMRSWSFWSSVIRLIAEREVAKDADSSLGTALITSASQFEVAIREVKGQSLSESVIALNPWRSIPHKFRYSKLPLNLLNREW